MVNYKRVGEQERGAGPSLYYQPLFVAEVVEYRRGGDIERKITEAMNRSQLYVGLFGEKYSDRTRREYLDALNRGMTTLVYYFNSALRTLKESEDASNEVYKFLMKDVYPLKVAIRGNYDRIEIKTLEKLADEIVVDLLAELTDMIRLYHGVQKAIKGFQH